MQGSEFKPLNGNNQRTGSTQGQAPSLDDERCANADGWNAGGVPGANVLSAESSSWCCYKQLLNLALQPPFKHLHVLALYIMLFVFYKLAVAATKS